MAFNLISKSGSPVLTSQTLDAARDYDFSDNNRETMTMSGFSNKLIMLVAITAIIAMALVNVLDVGSSVMLSSVSAIVGFILVLVMSIKPNTAPYIAVPYAVAEGCFLSGVVLYAETLLPGVAFNALLGTLALLVATVVCYRTGLIKVNEKFLSIFKFAVAGSFVYVILGLVSSFFMQSVYEGLFSWTKGGLLGIGVCILLIVFGAMSLVLDLFLVEDGIQRGLPKSYEWYCSMSILVTVVYIYVKILELIIRIAYSSSSD